LKKFLALLTVAAALHLAPVWLVAQHRAAAPQPVESFAALAPGERIPNLDKLKDELKQYHDCTCKCGCYAKGLDLQAGRAIAFLRQRVAHRRPQEKLALVLDIDETTLSNYTQMVKSDFGYDAQASAAWESSAAAPAIPGTLRIFGEARRLGVSVFFLTGRSEPLRAATERNLRTQGFDGWQQLILRSSAQASSTALAYKSAARAGIEAQGYAIVLNVGDQWSDLQGKPEAEFSVKYPDPFYFIR
jgi:acid phosphatase